MEKIIPAALKVALEFEEKGRNFYRKTAADARDPLSRKLFSDLAEDEEKHAGRIREIFAGLSLTLAWPHSPDQGNLMERELKAFFLAHKDTLRPETYAGEGYAFAMEMERAGMELYLQFAEESRDPQEKEFFRALAEEEKMHLDALVNVHMFLMQTGEPLQETERKYWNWMKA
jgi:rubrerythrin